MKLPPNKTEAEVLEAIEKAVAILSRSFVFGFYDIDDIRQQARLFGLEALQRYDGLRPLENFIYSHIKNRLINLKRDKMRRSDPPCKACHAGAACTDGGYCPKYAAWLKRNNAKSNLLRPLDIDSVNDERERRARTESSVVNEAEMRELLENIDLNLPVALRASYLQMRDGVSLPKAKRQLVEEAIREIMSRGKQEEME